MAEIDVIERNIINSINNTVQFNRNKPIILSLGEKIFTDITGARRYSGSLYGPNEPYTDFIIQKRNTKGLKIALKSVVFNESIQRLEIIVPGLKYKFIRAAYNKIMQLKLEFGQDVPEIFGKIDRRHINMLIRGTYSVGGPIDYMFINISKKNNFEYNEDLNTLAIPGELVDIDTYSKNINLFLNLKPLYPDQKFDPDAERGGMKLIYGESESRGDMGNKIIVTTETTDNGIIVDIE